MNPEDKGVFEIPAQLWLKILEIAVLTGRSEEEVVEGLMRSVLDMANTPDQMELKGFAAQVLALSRDGQIDLKSNDGGAFENTD